MGALPLNARVAHIRLIFWWRESGITRVRAGKRQSSLRLRRVWTLRSHVIHSVGLDVEDLSAGVNGIREEEEPTSDADDDFDEPEPPGRDAQRRRAAAERNEHNRAADVAVEAGALEQRPRRAANAAANAAMDALEQRGELA